jgi:mannose-6-phosphate isomerase
MDLYPYTFVPVYVEKIWGGRSLERLFGRKLPHGKRIGESWELADLPQGVSVVSAGPAAGTTLTDLTAALGPALLGPAAPAAHGRLPLLLKLLDANDILSLQVHPDAEAARRIGGDAALKTECWYVLESRGGFIYKGVREGVTAAAFRQAAEGDDVEHLVQRVDVAAGDFHYLPAGTVHALGPGVVVAEVQTPSDTTYRVTDWGRGRQTHLERAMECIHFNPAPDTAPHPPGPDLLVTEFFTVSLGSAAGPQSLPLPAGRCTAVMVLEADGPVAIRHDGASEPAVSAPAGTTVLIPAALSNPAVCAGGRARWLQITLPRRDPARAPSAAGAG